MRESKLSKKILIFLVILVLIISTLIFTACNASKDTFSFGTLFSVYVTGTSSEKTINSIFDYVDSLEPILSVREVNSDLDKINKANVGVPIECHKETIEILNIAYDVYQSSNGAFDPSVYPLVDELWKFSADKFQPNINNFTPPSEAEIKEKLKLVGLDAMFYIDGSKVIKKVEGAMLDLGGIAKGYAVEKALRFIKDKQTALLNLGGNIAVINDSFEIQIADPSIENPSSDTVASVVLHSGECIATSGNYQRYYKVQDGDQVKYYHHIIDPSTGYPSDNNLMSVSVISKNGALGDAVATACMVKGFEEGEIYINKLGLKAVFIQNIDGKLVINKVGF